MAPGRERREEVLELPEVSTATPITRLFLSYFYKEGATGKVKEKDEP